MNLGITSAKTIDNKSIKKITIAYIADIHAQIQEHQEMFWENNKEYFTNAGGLSRIAYVVNKLRKENSGNLLFMDAGDTFQGSGPAALSKGEAIIEPMNSIGLDLAALGNWEVVYGKERLLEITDKLNYPIIASNIVDKYTNKLIFDPYIIKIIDGIKVGILGYTDPDVPERQPPSYSKGLIYKDKEVLQPLIDRMKNDDKVDIVILLTHIGLPKAVNLARQLQNVDILLSGDTHERTYEPINIGNTMVVEPGSFGSFLGKVDLYISQGKIIDKRWELIELKSNDFQKDPNIQSVVEKALLSYRSKMENVIGYTNIYLYRYNVVETNMDAMLSDAIREITNTDIALSNGFRFSHPIPPGYITEEDLWNVYPVVEKLKVGKIYGWQLREFWEKELENVFSQDPDKQFGGWLPRPSGMKITFNACAEFGNRIDSIYVGDKPLVDNKIYTIAACEREGDPEDVICRIPDVKDTTTLNITNHEAVKIYLSNNSPISNIKMGRVVVKDIKTEVRSQYFDIKCK
ncbi:MAG: bifunctional metallophosphatase/5'-nucleotidase [Deferribacterota bacterium]|nr:bifunctional metallophosphatase/5'-nucleotidase [Deferribacterota bacterium]